MILVLKAALLKAGVAAPLHMIGWVVLAPVLIFILKHEASVFPGKLAKRMSGRLSEELSGEGSMLYTKLSNAIVEVSIGVVKQAILDTGHQVGTDRELRAAIQQANFEAFLSRALGNADPS